MEDADIPGDLPEGAMGRVQKTMKLLQSRMAEAFGGRVKLLYQPVLWPLLYDYFWARLVRDVVEQHRHRVRRRR